MQHPNVSISLQLHRDAHGRLVLTLPDGTVHSGVVPVRAFPLAAPQEGLSIVGSDGHELIWLDRFDALPDAVRALGGIAVLGLVLMAVTAVVVVIANRVAHVRVMPDGR